MTGLPRDASRLHVELAHALYDRDHRAARYGDFIAFGHVHGRHYQDRHVKGGATHRVWDDGEVQRLPDSPQAPP